MRTPVITTSIHARRVTVQALLAPLVAGVLAACGNDAVFTQLATVSNVSTTASVYALTGSAPELPAAYSMVNGAFVRPAVLSDGSVNFDLAFDIDAQGKVVILPVRKVVPTPPFPSTGAPSVGLLKSSIAYDVITRAAERGYKLDSAVVASPGDTYFLQLPAAGCVFGEPYFGKIVIDSVFVADRRIVVRALTNRNCGGYRSLTTGLPKD